MSQAHNMVWIDRIHIICIPHSILEHAFYIIFLSIY